MKELLYQSPNSNKRLSHVNNLFSSVQDTVPCSQAHFSVVTSLDTDTEGEAGLTTAIEQVKF